jgi:hypothetical protein
MEPSGPVQACNGRALPLPLPFSHTFINQVYELRCLFLIQPHRARQLYRIESPYLPGQLLISALLRVSKKETHCIMTQGVSLKICQELNIVCAVTVTIVSRLLGYGEIAGGVVHPLSVSGTRNLRDAKFNFAYLNGIRPVSPRRGDNSACAN